MFETVYVSCSTTPETFQRQRTSSLELFIATLWLRPWNLLGDPNVPAPCLNFLSLLALLAAILSYNIVRLCDCVTDHAVHHADDPLKARLH